MKVNLHRSRPGEALADVPAAARDAERNGFSGISFGEVSCDPLLMLTVAAGVTESLDLMTNLSVAFARSPMTMAVQARALQEYSSGRLLLGLGSQIRPHIERRYSMPWGRPAPQMAEFIGAMRAIWQWWRTGDAVAFQGEFYTHTLSHPIFVPSIEQPDPPILLAAVGERMTEVAGQHADGFLIHPYTTLRYFEEITRPALEKGLTKRAGDHTDFEIVAAPMVVTGATEEEFAEALRDVRTRIAFDGSTRNYRRVLELHGWSELADELHRFSKTDDPDRWEVAANLIDDEVLLAFAVVGEPERVGPQLRERWGSIVQRIELSDIGMVNPTVRRTVLSSFDL